MIKIATEHSNLTVNVKYSVYVLYCVHISKCVYVCVEVIHAPRGTIKTRCVIVLGQSTKGFRSNGANVRRSHIAGGLF